MTKTKIKAAAMGQKVETTRSQNAASDVAVLLRARNPLLWIVTREEARVESYIIEAASAAAYKPRTWDVAQGLILEINGKPNDAESQDPGVALDKIRDWALRAADKKPERGVWVLRDLPVWLEGPGAARTLRQLRNLVRMLPGTPRDSAQAVIVLSPSGNVPPELAGHATVIEWPLPDRAEIASLFDATIDSLPDALRASASTSATREAAIDAAVGLTGEEVQACFSKSLVQLRRVDPVTVGKEKKRVVAREGVLEWFDPLPGGLDSVGGLDNLKRWLLQRKLAYSPEARAYGLPSPKGTLLVGISGCGKSLTAKAVSTAYEVPLLRIDLGALKSKFVGESEGNLRKAFNVIAAIGRCVVWFDEVEKALQGATSGSADGGVSSDALGAILSWMQDRQGEAFVIATANDVTALPPEFLRKGRFDEVWFVDLPNYNERIEVLRSALKFAKRESADINFDVVAGFTEKFTGSEIAALVPDAMFAAFADDAREIRTEDFILAAKSVIPLSVTASVKIDALREWAKTRARKATSEPKTARETIKRGRQLDVEV